MVCVQNAVKEALTALLTTNWKCSKPEASVVVVTRIENVVWIAVTISLRAGWLSFNWQVTVMNALGRSAVLMRMVRYGECLLTEVSRYFRCKPLVECLWVKYVGGNNSSMMVTNFLCLVMVASDVKNSIWVAMIAIACW